MRAIMIAMEDRLLSIGVVAFVGVPGRLDRRTPEDRVTEAVGSAAPDVLPRIRVIVDELRETNIQWTSGSGSEMSQRAEAWLRGRHPELSHDAVFALTNEFTFNYK